MEQTFRTEKRTDNQLIVLTHLSQLLTYFTGFGGLIAPLIIWATQKDEVKEMDVHGKAIVNFQLTMLLFALISIPLILAFGLGILSLILICILTFIMPIINAVKASNLQQPYYPLSIQFIK